MHRRDFLRIGALGTAAVATDALASEPHEEPLSQAELKRRVGKLEKGLAHIDRVDYGILDAIPPERRDADTLERVALDSQLVRSSMRAMLVTSSLADVPVANREDETLLAMVDAHSVEADFALFGMLDRVESMSDAEIRDLQAAIREDPDLPMKAAELIDREAAAAGIGHRRRLHFREIASHVAWKMQHQPLALVVSEAATKTRKTIDGLVANPDALRPPATSMADLEAWADRSRRVRHRFADREEPPMPSPGEAPPARVRGDGRRALRDSAIFLGAGVGAAALGALLVATGETGGVVIGLFVLTAAAGLLISGLILLLIGAIRAGSR